MPTYTQLTIGNPDGAQIGDATTDKISFHGVTPVDQYSSTAMAALTTTTIGSNGYGFATSAGFTSLIAQVEAIRALLVEKGLSGTT